MSVTAAETVTFDRDDIRDLAVDVEAIGTYIFDAVNGRGAAVVDLEVVTRIAAIYERLTTALGIHDDHPALDILDEEGFNRGREWLAADRAGIAQAFTHHLLGGRDA